MINYRLEEVCVGNTRIQYYKYTLYMILMAIAVSVSSQLVEDSDADILLSVLFKSLELVLIFLWFMVARANDDVTLSL